MRFMVWRKPPRDRGRPARTIVRHGLAGVRHWERPATAPWDSLRPAVAFHPKRPAASPQGRSNAPRPPPRNKDAGGTPALPGGTPPPGGSDSRALNQVPCPIPGHDVNHVCGFWCGGSPPGTAGVPPAPLSGTASPVSATGTDRQRRRGFPWDLPLRFTTNGLLPARKVVATLPYLHQEIRLRAGRPRSRVALPRKGGVILER